jgi:hypothetical protein
MRVDELAGVAVRHPATGEVVREGKLGLAGGIEHGELLGLEAQIRGAQVDRELVGVLAPTSGTTRARC